MAGCKNNLNRYPDQVDQGQEILIRNRDKAASKIVAVKGEKLMRNRSLSRFDGALEAFNNF